MKMNKEFPTEREYDIAKSKDIPRWMYKTIKTTSSKSEYIY